MREDWKSCPAGSLSGEIEVPGDKSISHRAIIFAAIAEGTSTIRGFLEGEDCLATVRAFRAMGVRIEGPENGQIVVHGVGKHGLNAPENPIDCGNSGTSMRLLAGLLASQPFDSVLTGDESLLRRPMARVTEPLNQMGAEVIASKNGTPPLIIHGGKSLKGIDYALPVASAQVKSALLLAGLYALSETRIREPRLTRDHTERMMAAFGVPLEKEGHALTLKPGGELRATDLSVPCDISSAAFFLVAASIIPGSALTLLNVGMNPGRTGILDILARMKADIRVTNTRFYGGEPVADLEVRHAPLQGIAIPPELVPNAIDEFPAIFIAAASARGVTTLSGAEELRTKESDRIQMMAEGLLELGITVTVLPDGICIEGGELRGGRVKTAHDHRIAMAFAIAGAASREGVIIEDCVNVATSFPGFVACANRVHLDIQELDYDV